MFVPDRTKDARTSAWIMQRTPSPIKDKLTSGEDVASSAYSMASIAKSLPDAKAILVCEANL